MRRTTRWAIAPIAVATALTLAACGGDDEETSSPAPVEEPSEPEAPEEPESESEDAPEETESEDAPEETESEDAPEESESDEPAADGEAGAGSAAPWANPITEDGELLGTIELGDVTVDVYEVARDQATRSSIWADPDTEEPIVNEGDDVLVLNYVVTNNGEPVNLSYGLVEVGLNYDSWPYMQQPSVADNDLLAELGVNDNGVNSDSLGEDVYTLGSGEQYSVGQVMLLQPGEAYTIEAEFEGRDEAGERNGDEREGELTGTVE